jgi:hypothetical protein
VPPLNTTKHRLVRSIPIPIPIPIPTGRPRVTHDDDTPAVANDTCTMCGGSGRANDGTECPLCKGSGTIDVSLPEGS